MAVHIKLIKNNIKGNKILCLSGGQVGYTIRNVKTAEVRSNKEKQENSSVKTS